MQKLLEKGISSRRGIMTAHQESAYKHSEVNLPKSEYLRDKSIILPLFIQLDNEEQNKIIKNVLEIISNS